MGRQRGLEEGFVGGGFFLQRQGIGAGGGWHAVEAEGADINMSADGRDGAGEGLGDDGTGFFAGGDESVAGRDSGQESGNIGGGDDFEEGVGGVVLQAADFGGGVVEGEAGVGTEGANQSFVKPLLARHTEVRLVPKVNQPHDAPEVVDPVGVIERHAPAVLLRRETAEE